MDWIILGLLVINGLLFGGIGLWAIREGLRDPSPQLRTMSALIAAACIAFVLGSIHRAALVADRLGAVPDRYGEFLRFDLQLIGSVAALAFGLCGVVMVRRMIVEMRRIDRVVSVLTDRVAVNTSVSELGLTPRELQVLEVIATGALTDEEIACQLYVAPATAKTHVKNILRKGGFHSRRALLLLSQHEELTSSARIRRRSS